MESTGSEVKDVYFRRFLVPIIISLLVFCLVAVIITTPPGTQVQWNTFSSAMGGIPKQLGGALRRGIF
jgi:hypothetical protein